MMQEKVASSQLLYIFLMLLSIVVVAEGDYKHRTKRKVAFSKSSKIFFRLNGKDNMLNYTDIFAHGWTIRINYDLPETIPQRHQFFKRDIHSQLKENMEILGGQKATKDVYSCIRKYICEKSSLVQLNQENCGIFCGIGNIISRANTMEAKFFKSFLNNCSQHYINCPYSFTDGFG